MSEAADIVELLAAGFARASRPTKVVLQRSLPRTLLPQRLAADAASDDDKEAADTAESAAARFARASRPTKVVLQRSLPRPLLPLLSDVLPMPRLRITSVEINRR